MEAPRHSTTSRPAVLESVSVFYGEVIGLSKVNLELAPGITGVIGPNGSGKTTLMRVLTGLVDPSEGTVWVLGGQPFSSAAVRKRISFVPATECFYENLSARRNLEVAFLAHGYDPATAKAQTRRGLELVALEAEASRRYGTWSRGMRQRLKLALALVIDAELVLLDEPFLGVDPPTRKYLRDVILDLGSSGRTVLISSHVLHEIESLTDQVGILSHGRLLGFGKVGQLLHDLRDRHPHRVQIEADDSRKLATELISLPHVPEVQIVDDHMVEFVTEHPEKAYRELAPVVVRSGVLIRRVETLDNGLEAVFRHVTEAGAGRL
jgi:ABC-2 type transport system ATP-binding protein